MSGIGLLLLLTGMSSCEKDDVDEFGSAQIKIVNAGEDSGSQNFYLLGNLLESDVQYKESSSYLSTNSGNRLSAAFRTTSTGQDYAKGELWIANTKHYTVYLVGSGSSARIKQYEDDLSAPSAGKAKIKFIHLSDGITSDIRIKDNKGDEIVNNVSRNTESGYKTVDAGNHSFSVYATGTGNLIKTTDEFSLNPGRIYTIFLSGESPGTLEAGLIGY